MDMEGGGGLLGPGGGGFRVKPWSVHVTAELTTQAACQSKVMGRISRSLLRRVVMDQLASPEAEVEARMVAVQGGPFTIDAGLFVVTVCDQGVSNGRQRFSISEIAPRDGL